MLRKNHGSQILFHKNNQKAVLLIHCFRSNPNILKDISNLLFKSGYSIYNLRLPGHGHKNPDEILKTKLRDWEILVENIYLDLQDRFKNVYLCGISLGGTLVLNLCLKYNSIKKAVLYSPLLKVRQKAVFMAVILKFFKKKMTPSKIDCSINTDHKKDFIPFFPVPQGYEAYKLSNKVRKKINHVKTKILCFLSKNDHDINYDDHKNIIENKTNFKLISLDKSFHLISIDIEKDFVFKETVKWFD